MRRRNKYYRIVKYGIKHFNKHTDKFIEVAKRESKSHKNDVELQYFIENAKAVKQSEVEEIVQETATKFACDNVFLSFMLMVLVLMTKPYVPIEVSVPVFVIGLLWFVRSVVTFFLSELLPRGTINGSVDGISIAFMGVKVLRLETGTKV